MKPSKTSPALPGRDGPRVPTAVSGACEPLAGSLKRKFEISSHAEPARAGQLKTVEREPSVFAKVEGERAARAPEAHATGGDRCDAVCSCGHPCHMHADRERCTECECVAFRTAGDGERHPADVAMDICVGLWGPEGS